MSLLAPLYVAGLLAISLPILFHLIRRTPRGRQDFSSLMFLQPSPPRITRRSRLSNVLLLLLRAAALALLAFAFARPFMRSSAAENVAQSEGRRVAILVDASASMRRGDLWRQAVARAEEALGKLTPSDEAALYFFDRHVRPAMTFAEWGELDHPRRVAAMKARLAEASPSWESTRLGDALSTVADALAEAEGSKDAGAKSGRQLVLISDMQEGGHVDALQGHEWPESVVLDVKTVAPREPGNAGLHLVKESTGAEFAAAGPETKPSEAAGAAPGAPRLRVRVSNESDSKREQFTLAWADERGPLPGVEPVKAYVAPGRSQVVRVPWPAPELKADRLVLSGDDADFDNTLYVVPQRQDAVRVLLLADDLAEDTRGLRYYLQSALSDTPRRKVEVIARGEGEPLAEQDVTGARLVIVASPQSDARAAVLRRYAEGGGDVLWVLRDVAAAQGLGAAVGGEVPEVAEAESKNYALLARVETNHPLFAPFAEARFGDFTKIHFWKHRKLNVPESPGVRVVASFDSGDPFLVEHSVGRGRVLVMTSGWHPADSQLALSTKFVPLLEGLVRRKDGADVEAQYVVGEPVALPQAPPDSPKGAVRGPDGRRVELAAAATTFGGADRPGVYRMELAGGEVPLAVNVSPDESRTAPVAVEELEQWGARLGTEVVPEEFAARQRQLQILELENRQKLWRWLIVAVLGLLAAETALAGGLTRMAARQPVQEQVTT